MQLAELLRGYFELPTEADCPISGIAQDSRQVSAGDLFIALKGTALDGVTYVSSALQQGAAAVLYEMQEAQHEIGWQAGIPLIPIAGLRQRVGEIASRFYGDPSTKLTLFGVTGTNGKTSCTHFIAQLLEALQVHCGIIGTLGYGFYGALTETGLTTPDAVHLQKILQQFTVHHAAQAVAMEVSSHSIDQDRISGIHFQQGIFTNLTQDHLDYHGDMATYAAVKKRFLTNTLTQSVIINADDPYGRAWLPALAQQKPVYAYGCQPLPHFNGSFTQATSIQLDAGNIKARVITPWGEGDLCLPLVGQFNLSNALAALTALCAAHYPFAAVFPWLNQLHAIPGRMQTLGGQGKPVVVVDYAHTPDALQKVLQALRAHGQGRLICVFGCGGDRDASKRPLMAAIAEQYADQVIVTNDNPRHEAPEKIAKDIMNGFKFPNHIDVILDRSKAIQNSIQLAKRSDCVLIAGKGAESYQQIGDNRWPFDDVAQVTRWLAEWVPLKN